MRLAKALIDLDNLSENVKNLRAMANSKHFMAVVKADAYGHGAVPVAKTALLSGADHLAVGLIQEGITLRKAGVDAPILIFGWTPYDCASLLVKYRLTQSVISIEQAVGLSEMAMRIGGKIAIHIKIETGMNRVGFSPTQETIQDLNRIFTLEGLTVEGIFSHFADADDRQSTYTDLQFSKFQTFLNQLETEILDSTLKHCANTAALINHPNTHLDMVRVGIGIYGCYPNPYMADSVKLKPVMSLRARITQVKWIEDGETVSYARAFKAVGPRKIATVPLGYADGYRRILSNRSSVLINEEYAPVVGRICMDQFMIDVTDLRSAVRSGDEVVLFGKNATGMELPVEAIAEMEGTISYEVFTSVSHRVPRIFKTNSEVIESFTKKLIAGDRGDGVWNG